MAAVNADIFYKYKGVKKLSTRQDGDGNEIEVEVREDEEQSVKCQEIIDLLVAAGYFRARIKGLSPFDKVVGGMTWCIECCNVGVDVDLLFQENSTIGQKIALTEKIVAVLPKMQCPHRIEPHQIQGLDFIHIFPVIQWLVKRSMEFRQEMSAFVRSYAINQFKKEFPNRSKILETQKRILENVNTVREIYRPRRFYRRKTAPPEDVQSKVHITLLEYGLHGDIKSTNSKPSTPDSLEVQRIPEFDMRQLLTNMTATEEELFNYESLNQEEKLELDRHYASLLSEIEDGGTKSKEEKQLKVLKVQKQLLHEQAVKLESDKKVLESDLLENTLFLQEIKIKQKEANQTLQELAEAESNDPEGLKEIEELVILNDSLKTQELQFRDYCKQELARLQTLIEEVKHPKLPSDTNDTNREIENETEKLKVLRLQLGKKNRAIATLQRKLDDIPSRAELAQYQTRFLELYNQVAAKHKETKQYYTLYNTLDDTRLYMKKELSLLNSVSDSYPEAILSNSGKEEFIKQFEAIVDGVKQSRVKVEQKLSEERRKRDHLSNTLQILIEQQRRYATAVRQLSMDCRKYENLLSQCHS